LLQIKHAGVILDALSILSEPIMFHLHQKFTRKNEIWSLWNHRVDPALGTNSRIPLFTAAPVFQDFIRWKNRRTAETTAPGGSLARITVVHTELDGGSYICHSASL
jgi:hypothetical protein